VKVEKTAIEGLFHITLDVFPDNRGDFREAWQAEKMEAAGLPHFEPVQFNVSRSKHGVIRGIHAEPWEKCVHIADGTVFVAIVELRENENFGKVVTFELDDTQAIFLPSGVGNSFQVLSEQAVYCYVVNAHWSPEAQYAFVRYDDPTLNIQWPIQGEAQIVSDKDRAHATLKEVFSGQFH